MRTQPHLSLVVDRARRPVREPLPDADIVILLAVLSPAFLLAVIWTIVRGEAFGTEATMSAALVVLAVLAAVSALQSRGRAQRK
jgi:hypothetical protein